VGCGVGLGKESHIYIYICMCGAVDVLQFEEFVGCYNIYKLRLVFIIFFLGGIPGA